ncbi:MAG: bifunctional proline dehydrogenase/L-glutamate gamma-semialdehyde dehydrogenase PutA [Candidatus Puniceispirillaceae bacterium]
MCKRQHWDANKLRHEDDVISDLIKMANLSPQTRKRIALQARDLVIKVRSSSKPELMEMFLAEYGLSTQEGIALMCLAEALLRVPDDVTIDILIEDKIAPSDWSKHLGQSSSPMVNASTWALLFTGKVLDVTDTSIAQNLHKMVKRLGEPSIRKAVSAAIKFMGNQFVLGEKISAAVHRAKTLEEEGYTYSYDMLGEAAITAEDAERYNKAYHNAINVISKSCRGKEIAENPGISIKLSALHPRYEAFQRDRAITELVPIVKDLAIQAANAGIGLNIDAEEADRLALSMEIIDAVLSSDELIGWRGFGVVVQAYSRRASDVIDGLYAMAQKYDRHIMVRLVKGAYWDSEIKKAQIDGLTDFPVFTRKEASDVSYIAMAQKLLTMTDRIYPQFATHNAHSVSAILEMASEVPKSKFEFQRLHGMGARLHKIIHKQEGTRCRIYAPVGEHRDLLAYLVRRLLENGANSSFVNQIVDKTISPDIVAACPFDALEKNKNNDLVQYGHELFMPMRRNALGFDLSNMITQHAIIKARYRPCSLHAHPICVSPSHSQITEDNIDPSTGELIGRIVMASEADAENAISAALPWEESQKERADILNKVADLYEKYYGEIFSILAIEAGKTWPDAVAELREAVDFLRYYAKQSQLLAHPARGVVTCISPWNFPLAIFTGQIAAALASGNGVLAKPAETTSAIATWAVTKFHQAGVPQAVLQLVTGYGPQIGKKLVSDQRINAVVFTGSTRTAKQIQASMADHCIPGTPLIAETGGINAMIVDSTALPEQAIKDILVSAFQSAGQRCSALRCLYLQDDIADRFIHQLTGAMDELSIGNPWALSTDIGPVITSHAKAHIEQYILLAKEDGRLLYQLPERPSGYFVSPSLVSVSGIEDIKEEVFGPVLHIARFKAKDLPTVIAAMNNTGYGLTFGIHTRIDDRIQMMADHVNAGNIYANRNQIGAIVGSQPFGGEGLSGTGPKAGGANYLPRFTKAPLPIMSHGSETEMSTAHFSKACAKHNDKDHQAETSHLPGPTGELNQLFYKPCAPIICAGPSAQAMAEQYSAVISLGGVAVKKDIVAEDLQGGDEIGGVIWWGDEATAGKFAKVLATRDGPIIPLICDYPDKAHVIAERHLCIDTTAAGGNATLLNGNET